LPQPVLAQHGGHGGGGGFHGGSGGGFHGGGGGVGFYKPCTPVTCFARTGRGATLVKLKILATLRQKPRHPADGGDAYNLYCQAVISKPVTSNKLDFHSNIN
jgi:hypothetical protein